MKRRLSFIAAGMVAAAALYLRRQPQQQQPDEHAQWLGADAGGAGAFTHNGSVSTDV